MADTSHPRTGQMIAGVESRFRDALRECAAGREPWPLTLIGNAGIGKTCAALCLADYVNGRCWLTTLEELCDVLQLIRKAKSTPVFAYREENWSAGFLWEKYEDYDLFIIDEIGVKPSLAWDADLHLNTIKKALDLREGKPLILTSNLSVAKTYELYDERVVSRIKDGTVVEIDGPDRRVRE